MRNIKSREIDKGSPPRGGILLTRKGPGRKPSVVPFDVYKRAVDLGQLLQLCREQIDWDGLLAAKTEDEVRLAFERAPEHYRSQVLGKARPDLILEWLREGRLPKQRREFLTRHLADSLAGEGYVSPRRSRDLVAEERRKRKKRGQIVRFEYYVECTCGYKGVSRNHACRRCGAPIKPAPPIPAYSNYPPQKG